MPVAVPIVGILRSVILVMRWGIFYCTVQALQWWRVKHIVVVAAMSTMTMTIENYWITATGWALEKEELQLDCTTTSYICKDKWECQQYIKYLNRLRRNICGIVGKVMVNAIGHGNFQLTLKLYSGYHCDYTVVVNVVLHVVGTSDLLSLSKNIELKLYIVPVTSYSIMTHNRCPTDYFWWWVKLMKCCGYRTPNWTVILARCEHCWKQILHVRRIDCN